MRVAVNALYLRPGQVGGTERYLRELLARLCRLEPQSEWVVYLPAEARGALNDLGPNLRECVLGVRARHRVRRVLAEQSLLARAIARQGCALCWNPGASLPLASGLPQVTTVHDCQSRRFPKNFALLERAAIEFQVGAAVRRSKWLLVPSKATRADLIAHYRADPARVIVTPLAAAPAFAPGPAPGDGETLARLGLEAGGYLLSVASSLPHKNLPLLFEAYARASRRSGANLPPLLWTGPGERRTVEALAARSGIGRRVRALGWQPPETMPALYRGALGALLASAFEGFGLAALEALACGTPLLTTPTGAIAEVVGEAALLTATFEPDELAGAIIRLCQEGPLRERLARAGPERARRFSWERTAEQTLAALIRAAYE